MALQDQIIKRLRDRGVRVVDVRHQLPRNGTWLRRPVSVIKQIAAHHDAEPRPRAYDSLARYIAQARYHVNKDWNPPRGVRGDGLMYAWKIDNVGVIFVTRDLEDVLWSVGDKNYVTASYCFDGTTGNGCTREQIQAEQYLLEVLCFNTPEIPAGQANVLGHQEVPGNSTACPGDFLPSIRSYRAERNTHPERYTPEVKTSAPAPLPEAPKLPTVPILIPPLPIPTPAPGPVVSEPVPPAPGTIIQPEPGKGGSIIPEQEPNKPAEELEVEAPSKPPAEVPVKVSPAPIAQDHFEVFEQPQNMLLLADSYAINIHGKGPAKGPYKEGTPITGLTGVLTQAETGRRFYVGRDYAIPVEAFEPDPDDDEDQAPEMPVPPALGELLRAVGSWVRAIHGWLTKPRKLNKD
jgi:hypothetical protein